MFWQNDVCFGLNKSTNIIKSIFNNIVLLIRAMPNDNFLTLDKTAVFPREAARALPAEELEGVPRVGEDKRLVPARSHPS